MLKFKVLLFEVVNVIEGVVATVNVSKINLEKEIKKLLNNTLKKFRKKILLNS